MLIYWGNKGGGKRLLNEVIADINLSGFKTVFLSVAKEVHEELISDFPNLILINCKSPKIDSIRTLIKALIFGKLFKTRRLIISTCTQDHLRSLVVVMSHPGDLVLTGMKKYGLTVIRVIHDLSKHHGEFWPTHIESGIILKADKLICLSKFTFNQIKRENVYLSSLSRRRYVGEIRKVEGLPESYILISGRFKKYQNILNVHHAIAELPGINFVAAGRGSGIFSDLNQVKCYDYWLNDAELEYIVKNAKGLIAAYTEASQSGIVDQAIYWRVPVLISDRGALKEQIEKQNTGLICDPDSIESIIFGIQKLVAIDNKLIPAQVVSETLSETILRI